MNGIAAARAEREQSEKALRHAQEHVIGPLRALEKQPGNHFAEMIRNSILAGYGREHEGGA